MKTLKDIIKEARSKKAVLEASHDPREYDFEGEMAKRDLETIAMHIQRINSLIQDETNMPEWVQGKITLAKDYIQTVSDYLASDVQQEGQKSQPAI
jgi:serine protease inhibitor